ncbi:MAG: type II secretion system protein GspM [Marinicellaceae bacterium]
MQWYKQLTENERKLIVYGSILISLVLFWVGIYQPINNSIKEKSVQKLTLQQQLKEMQSSEQLLTQQNINKSNFQRDINQPFIAWIDSKLLENNLSEFVTRVEPKDNQTLILTFDSVVFDDLISWLQPLQENFNVNISEADIALLDRTNGLCNARITLEEK